MDDDDGEPIGSCEECGADIYSDDDDYLCGQCAWSVDQANPEDTDDGD